MINFKLQSIFPTKALHYIIESLKTKILNANKKISWFLDKYDIMHVSTNGETR